jgi:hypothetical protein
LPLQLPFVEAHLSLGGFGKNRHRDGACVDSTLLIGRGDGLPTVTASFVLEDVRCALPIDAKDAEPRSLF